MKITPLSAGRLTLAVMLSTAAAAHAAAPDGAALAESCAACHGTDTNSRHGFEDLLGESELDELFEMKYHNPPENLMDYVARTYTDEQLTAISQFFARH